MSIVVNGMDLNTTMVSKMQKMVKNIKGRYVKTHLYRILVHRWKLCCNVWIDAHHKHDSNQVVTSIMRILNYVYNARDELLQILYIWAVCYVGLFRRSQSRVSSSWIYILGY
jgi:hypothetical protein